MPFCVVAVVVVLLAAGKRQQLIRESEPEAWRESLNVTLPGHCLSRCSQVAKVPGQVPGERCADWVVDATSVLALKIVTVSSAAAAAWPCHHLHKKFISMSS